ncbi:MAG: hypothetical protein AAB229_09865, partial [Candidatus Hydrogenedentota bacterium]
IHARAVGHGGGDADDFFVVPRFFDQRARKNFGVGGRGGFGLAEVRSKGATPSAVTLTPVALPSGPATVSAMAARGPDLLVALDRELYLYRTTGQEWVRISVGTSYSALLLLPKQKWVGLRMDGGIDAGDVSVPSSFTSFTLPIAYDAVASIAVVERPAAEPFLLAGTVQGRILGGPVSLDEIPRAEVRVLRSAQTITHPIRAIASRDARMVIAGLDKGGILDVALFDENAPAETLTVSPDEPVQPVTANEDNQEIVSTKKSWRDYLSQLKQSTSLRTVVIGFSATAALIFLSWRLAQLMATRKDIRIKERRREPTGKSEIPELDELSGDLADKARTMKAVTDRINELSRDAAKGRAAEIAGQMAEVRKTFDELDAWMRDRLATIRDEREEKLARLNQMRKTDAVSSPEIEAELAGIERWLASSSVDEQYLKYVLEE